MYKSMTTKRVLIAPSAYKGTLSPGELAKAICQGAADSNVQCLLLPLADGGDGTIESINLAVGGQLKQVWVKGPLSQPVLASWLKLEQLSVIELASASGIALLEEERLDPLHAHTAGTGEVLAHCLSAGESNIVVTLGGSASTDGGTGALIALGAQFLDKQGNDLPLGGEALIDLYQCDLSGLQRWFGKARIRVATDVDSPLLGKSGAARIFAPQKGANDQQVALLEKGLTRLADVLEAVVGNFLRDKPGAGAAGGAAFGLAIGLGAEIIPGFSWIAEIVRLKEKIAACDLVITAEGKLDKQSLSGKATGELARMCASHNRPLWIIPALVESGIDWTRFGIERVVPAAQEGKIATANDVTRVSRQLFESYI